MHSKAYGEKQIKMQHNLPGFGKCTFFIQNGFMVKEYESVSLLNSTESLILQSIPHNHTALILSKWKLLTPCFTYEQWERESKQKL